MMDLSERVESLITRVLGVWKFEIPPTTGNVAYSTPGHLVHLVISGSYQLAMNNRRYVAGPGDLIYYHGREEVQWIRSDNVVVFYSVGFIAPTYPPFPYGRRVFPSTARARSLFDDLYEASRESGATRRALRTYAALFSILAEFDAHVDRSAVPYSPHDLWWRIEEALRRDRQFRPSLSKLVQLAHASRSTVIRACRDATGLSPGKRFQKLRMQEADGLLTLSPMTITEIAAYLGYSRVHEFSREFSRYFGHPATHYRRERQNRKTS